MTHLHYRLGFTVLVISLLFTSSCTNSDRSDLPLHIRDMENLTVYPADAEPRYDVELIREASFGDREEEDIFIRILVSVAVDDKNNVYLADAMQNMIHIYHPDGEYAESFGRTGFGPGEFRQINRLKIISDRLYVFDVVGSVNALGIKVFSLSGDSGSTPEYLHLVVLNPDQWMDVVEPGYTQPNFHSVRSDGLFLLHSVPSSAFSSENPDVARLIRYYVLPSEYTETLHHIFEQNMADVIRDDQGQSRISPSFLGSPELALSENDDIISAWSEDFLIRIHDPEGNYERAIYYPITKQTLTLEEAVTGFENNEELQRLILEAELPDTWPALRSIHVDDDNRLWVATNLNPDEDEIRLLNYSGELIAEFIWPRSRSIQLIRNGFLYTRERDPESGRVDIVKYRIELDEI